MPWWLVRLYLDGLEKEFARQDPDNHDYDESDEDTAFEREATVFDDPSEVGITVHQIQ